MHFVCSALKREINLTRKLQQSLEAEKSQQEVTGRERKMIEDLQVQLETERGKVHDLNNALQKEHRRTEEAMSSAEAEKCLLQQHLDQEREVNHHLKHDLDALQVCDQISPPALPNVLQKSEKFAFSWQDQQNDQCAQQGQISLVIHPVWSESLLCAQWVAKDPSFLHADREDSIRLGGCPGWSGSLLGTDHFVGLSWGGSHLDTPNNCCMLS